MMTLAIYDAHGSVIYSMSGGYTVPEGVPAIEVNVPDGQMIHSVDVTKNPPEAILVPNGYNALSLPEAKERRIEELRQNLENFLNQNKLKSDVHFGEEKYYSVSKEKQNQLIAEIITAERTKEKGSLYQPSWNAAGEVKTNDWTLNQLYDLLIEIKNYVGPFVEEEQSIEMGLQNAQTLTELYEIDIDFI